MSNPAPQEFNPHTDEHQRGTSSQTLRYANDPSPEQAASLPTLTLSPIDLSQDFEGRSKQALLLAEEAFAKTGSWVIFFREVLGVGGVVHQLFPDNEERDRFINTEAHATLHEMLAAIRSQDNSKSDAAEPERMITIRIPRSLHDLLKQQSEHCELSINKLCISKLLLPIASRFIPEQRGRRRGRRPGPQGSRGRKAIDQGGDATVISGNINPKEGW